MPAYRSERVYSRHSSRVYFTGTFKFRGPDATQPRVFFARGRGDGDKLEVRRLMLMLMPARSMNLLALQVYR